MSSEQTLSILVIGGSHGISFDLVQSLLESGNNVTAISRTTGRLESEGLLEHSHLRHIIADVINESISAEQLPQRLDGFVYCPGSIRFAAARTAKAEVLRAEFDLNVVGAMTCFQAALPALKNAKLASAVFFSTVAVNRGIAMHTYVAAVKGALQAMAKTWAAEFAPQIRVNCIAPALTDTPLAESLLSSEEKRSTMAAKYPLGRVGKPSDIAAMAEFLLSPKSGWITGQVYGVDGGMSTIVPV